MFPTPDAPNQVIGVTGKGASGGISTLMTDTIPDLQVIVNGQWVLSLALRPTDFHSPDAWAQTDDTGLDTVPGYRRVDNITDWCQQQFRTQYPALQITKRRHLVLPLQPAACPGLPGEYRNDLAKDLPRIPFASDFGAFMDAGAALAQLHLGYETCPEYELQVDVSSVRPWGLPAE